MCMVPAQALTPTIQCIQPSTYMNDYILFSIDRSHLSPIIFHLEVHLQLFLGQFQALDKARAILLAFSLTLGRLEELAPFVCIF
jgi:hypothetical protein